MFEKMLIDPRFQAARRWSNDELRKVAPVLAGSVVNVSGWRDSDKENGTYKENYFTAATEYWITNWKSDARGLQGDLENEIFLDLEEELQEGLRGKFDVVFSHTTLEHVFDVFRAFENLCSMSRDVVLVVVPFLQEQHGPYGDYWRFTPWSLKRLMERYGLKPAYINYNDNHKNAIYVVAAGARTPRSINLLHAIDGNHIDQVEDIDLGKKIFIRDSIVARIIKKLIKMFLKPNS